MLELILISSSFLVISRYDPALADSPSNGKRAGFNRSYRVRVKMVRVILQSVRLCLSRRFKLSNRDELHILEVHLQG